MASGSRTKNSIINVLTSMGGQVLVIVLKFVTRTVFIHTLGKAYLGINGLFSDILTMLSLTELGLDTALNFRLYKPLAENDEKRVRVLLKFYKQAYRVIGLVILGLGLCLIPLLPHLIKDYEKLAALNINAVLIFLIYLLQSVASYLFFAYRSAVMKANQKKYVLDVAEYAVTVAVNAVQICILVFLRSFILYTLAWMVAAIVKNLVNAVIARRWYPSFFLPEPDSLTRDEVRGLFKDCGALFIYKVNTVVVKATDNIVLSKFLGLATVGLYSNYLLFYTTIQSFLGKLYVAVKASMGNLFATSDLEKSYRFFQIMNYLTVILYGTAAVGVTVCANELIRVWISEDYVIAQPFAVLIGLEILFMGLAFNLGQIRNVSGAFRQMWYRPLMGIVINLVVSVALVRVCGVYGVIIGTVATLVLTNFLVDPHVIHKVSFQNTHPVSEYYKKNFAYIGVLTLVCLADLWLCARFFTGHGWLSVIVHALVVAVTVPGVLILVYYRTHECQYLLALLGRVLRRVRRAAAR
ncbi:MAG: oligosaccharide flippase family protein [Oscillospiraceae bacterium]|nr:oligosaccharide flippase family protein [Oscillospiraceae bacterium]